MHTNILSTFCWDRPLVLRYLHRDQLRSRKPHKILQGGGEALTRTDREKRIFDSGCDLDLVDLLEFVRLRTHACISHACQPVGLGPGEITHGVGFAYYTFLLDATSMPIIANDGIRLFPASARIPKITRSRGREVITTSG